MGEERSVNRRTVSLELSQEEAEALARAIYLIGENIAAGAPIPTDDQLFNERVGSIYKRLLEKIKD